MALGIKFGFDPSVKARIPMTYERLQNQTMAFLTDWLGRAFPGLQQVHLLYVDHIFEPTFELPLLLNFVAAMIFDAGE
jgi:hypothetical protein